MKQFVLMTLFGAAMACAAEPGKTFDQQLSGVEHEFVPLVQAMPADKIAFAPTAGEFKGVRTFAQQSTHVAATLYAVSAAILGEKDPSEMGHSENGPAALKSKAEVEKYVKDAFAYAHKAMLSLNDQNLQGMVKSPFGGGETSRLSLAITAISHSFDHYGQMVVYARMNGIIPPASR
jgi:hypothetical protein